MRVLVSSISGLPRQKAGVGSRVISLVAGVILVLVIGGCKPSTEADKLLQRLGSPNASIRLKAIQEAEKHPNRRLQNALLKMFEDDGELPIVRGAAGMTLGRLHDDRVPASVIRQAPKAVENARSGDRKHQLDAFLLGKVLVAYGPESMPALTPLLKHSRKDVVMWAIAQHGLYVRNDRALEVLSSFVENKDPVLRRAAVYGLAQLFHPAAEPKLIRALADLDPEVRYHAAWGLSNYGTMAATGVLERQLAKETEPQVKRELAAAIEGIKSRNVVSKPAVMSNPPSAKSARKR